MCIYIYIYTCAYSGPFTLARHCKQTYENSHVRAHLQSCGFVDERGKVIEVDKHRRKLHVIEQELAQAENNSNEIRETNASRYIHTQII